MTDSSADLAALAKGGKTNVFGFLLRLAARIPFLFIAGRIYGPEALGRLAYTVIVIEFAAQLATLGLKRGLALQLTNEDRDAAHIAWDALLVVLAASAIFTALLVSFPQAMFPNSAIRGLDRMMGGLVFVIAATEIMLAALAYRFDVAATVRARALVEPWTLSIAAAVLSFWSLKDGLLVSYALSMVGAFGAALVPFVRSYGWPRKWVPSSYALRKLVRRNLPLAASDAIEWGSRRVDVAILGLFVGPAVVGIYYVAQQLASLPQKLKTSFDPVLGPVITRNLELGDRRAVAAAICRAGFWIVAAQLGIALALGIPGAAIMGLIGKAGVFVGGNGILAMLLLAEVLAALAVVSESALVYIARYRNLAISLTALGLQIGLSFAFILLAKAEGWPAVWMAMGPAVALAISIGVGAVAKAWLAARELGAPIVILRWPMLAAAAVAAAIGGIATGTPEWSEILIGIPSMLAIYLWIIWRFAFEPEDRALFQRTARDPG
ncbi:lipopolysaccharide biosynthesis protein [Sphingomonas sp. SUN039]|uniref:lipopolysaccharide biosynthesis protein n=1 Tax=Sphingomonas sp. SUN039 TaxID=2937787 RepID=UPI002164EB22|nr:oligosaccharide flippase family protein [Sphingomonas sp. SUN039]UVO55050.1 oligosaccharide flippase family protein [Sphingomonas sp. SUN039]